MTIDATQKTKVASYYYHIDNGGLSIDIYREIFSDDPLDPYELYTIEFTSNYFGYPSIKTVISSIHRDYLSFYINSFRDLGNKVNV